MRRFAWATRSNATISILIFLFILVGAGNLWATKSYVQNFKDQFRQQQAAQKASDARQHALQLAQSALVEKRLCTTLDKLSSLKPPAGSASGNPSRLYEQQLHDVLAALGPDVGCNKG